MALSRVHVWIAGETLTASDLNAEFNNILNNAASLISPISGSFDLDGNTLIVDSAGGAQISGSTTNIINLLLASTSLFRFDGSATSPVNGFDFTASATGVAAQMRARGSDSDISINLVPKGAGGLQVNGVPVSYTDANAILAAQGFS